MNLEEELEKQKDVHLMLESEIVRCHENRGWYRLQRVFSVVAASFCTASYVFEGQHFTSTIIWAVSAVLAHVMLARNERKYDLALAMQNTATKKCIVLYQEIKKQ